MDNRRLSIVLMVAVSVILRSQERKPALTSRQVESLVRDLPDVRLAEEIRVRGVDPPITSSGLRRLLLAGAGPDTQSALKHFLIRSPLTVVVNPVVRDAVVTVEDYKVVTDSNGSVTIDGLAPGTHELVVEKPPAHPRMEERIVLNEGGSVIRIALSTATGKLTVTADNREAHVEIPNKGTFSLPLQNLELIAGTYSVLVTAPNYLPYRGEVEILSNHTTMLQPALSVDRVAMGRFVDANSNRLGSELRILLERGDIESFYAKSKVILDFAGDEILDLRLLHHHANDFHEAKLTLKRSGLLYEPIAACTWQAELFRWERITRTDITRQGLTGVLLLVEVAAGKNFDKRVALNFSVLGSSIGLESETKPIKAGRVTLGESTTTKNRVRSPSNAESILTGIAWIISEAQIKSHSKIADPTSGARAYQSGSDAKGTGGENNRDKNNAALERQAGTVANSSGDIIHIGQTEEEVKGLLGTPDKTENTNGGLIYVYTGLKVTFVGGKVTNVQ
jgi:hypothetical protein